MGLVIMKPCPHKVSVTHLVIWRQHAKFWPDWFYDLLLFFWQPKQLPVGVAMTIPHSHVVSNANPGIWRPHAKF